MYTDKQYYNILKGYNMLLYFAGTMIMYEPSEECITDFWEKGIVKNLPVSSSNPNFIKASSQLRESCNDGNFKGKLLLEDFNRLFLRQELPLAPPYESLYINDSQITSGKKVDGVSEFYSSYGWISKFKGKKNDDHLAVEILFLTRLIDNYLAMDDNACQVEMKKEIRRFIDHHLLTWVGEWNDKVQLHSNTLCFKGIGTLILACAEDVYSLFGQEPTTVFSLANLKN